MDNIDSLMISLVLEFGSKTKISFSSKSLGLNMLNSIFFLTGFIRATQSSEKK